MPTVSQLRLGHCVVPGLTQFAFTLSVRVVLGGEPTMEKCNGRIPRGLTPREPTFLVVLDAIALTLCYHAFLINADVPEGRDFDPLSSEEETVSFLRELGHTGEINSLNDVVSSNPLGYVLLEKCRLCGTALGNFIYQIDNRAFKKQRRGYDNEPVQNDKRVKRPTKEVIQLRTASVVIRGLYETKSKVGKASWMLSWERIELLSDKKTPTEVNLQYWGMMEDDNNMNKNHVMRQAMNLETTKDKFVEDAHVDNFLLFTKKMKFMY
ncbi:hypothetical protein Tco_0786287 [Tanacetum coccineum]